MNLYFYGGSFDPPHLGHKEIINYFSDISDKLLVIPAYQSPHKSYKPASFLHRKKMLKIMLEPLHQNLKIIDYEIDNKIEYTFETIKFLKKQYSATSLNMIIGLDQFNSISSWKNHKYILSNVNLLVISRPGYSPNDLIGNVKFIDNIKIDISSKEIRDNISNLKKIPSMFDNDVYDYIIKNNLYI